MVRLGVMRLGAALVVCSIVASSPGAVAATAPAAPAAPEVGRLVAALAGPDADARCRAAEALGRLGPGAATAVPALVGAFSDIDTYVQGSAAAALGRIGPGAVPALAKALADRERGTRWCAAIALARMGAGAREAASALVRALEDADENVRYCAAVALGGIGAPAAPAGPALAACLHDRDEDVRAAAEQALEAVDPRFAARSLEWRQAAATVEELAPALMRELHVPGVSVALVSGGQVVWTRAFGVADVRSGAPVKAETLFEACSMSKPVFAYLALKLAEQGRLDLDRPLADYFAEDDPPAQAEKRLITARMVLSHTSGLPNWRKGDEERQGPLPVLFVPGSRFGYSGEGMFYLQRVVERISGEPLDAYARRTLFAPLGLAHLSYAWTPAIEPELAAGHDDKGAFRTKTRYTHPNAAYSLYTSAPDFAAILVEIMKVDRSAPWSLAKPSIDAMLAHQVALDSREPIERPASARGLAVFWGLGWSINATAAGDIAHHSGSNRSGFRCFSQFNCARGTGIVIMTNGTAGGDLWTRLVSTIGDL